MAIYVDEACTLANKANKKTAFCRPLGLV